MTKPTLEIFEPSLISDMARRYDRAATNTDANDMSDERTKMLLGLPTAHVRHVRQPRAFTADTPSKASGTGRVYAHRSHRHYSNESEA